MPISINSQIKASEYSEILKETGRVRIPNFLSTDSAELIHDTLSKNTAWGLVYSNDEGKPILRNSAELESMQATEMHGIMKKLYTQGGSMYQYIYYVFPIIEGIKLGVITENSVLYDIATFLNGTAFLKFAHELTGVNSLVKFDPQATCFSRGHFLNLHDDMSDGREQNNTSVRRYAVVLGFTKNWSVNWGGQTNFFDRPGASVSESWFPMFNSISVFEVPALHSVNHVSPLANGRRYSITGWLRDDPQVHRPDLQNQT